MVGPGIGLSYPTPKWTISPQSGTKNLSYMFVCVFVGWGGGGYLYKIFIFVHIQYIRYCHCRYSTTVLCRKGCICLKLHNWNHTSRKWKGLALRKIYIQYRGISTVQIPTEFCHFRSYLIISLPARALAKLQTLPTVIRYFPRRTSLGLVLRKNLRIRGGHTLMMATGPGYPSLCNSCPMGGLFSTIADEKKLWTHNRVHTTMLVLMTCLFYGALQMKGRWESKINIWFLFMYSQKWNCEASLFPNRIIMFCLPIPTLLYLWEIYIFPGSVWLFCCSQIGGLILGINKSLTDTWMWKLGLRPCNSHKRNT